jgi:hypothetical protein
MLKLKFSFVIYVNTFYAQSSEIQFSNLICLLYINFCLFLKINNLKVQIWIIYYVKVKVKLSLYLIEGECKLSWL